MPQVEEIKTLNIDNEEVRVADASEAVQQMVDIFNEWSQQEAEARDRLMQIQAAKNDLSRNIILQVRKDKEPAEEEAPAEAEVEAENTEAADDE